MGIHKGFLFYGHLKPLFLNSISTDVYMLQLLLDGATLKSSNSSPFPFLFLAVIVEFQSLKGALHFPILFIFQSPRCFCSFPNRLAATVHFLIASLLLFIFQSSRPKEWKRRDSNSLELSGLYGCIIPRCPAHNT